MSGESIELRLAELKSAVDVGNANTAGQLALVVQRLNQQDEMRTAQRAELDGIHASIGRIDRKVAKAAGIAIGAAGVISAAEGLVVWALSHH